jgi:hypothetical protein
LMKYQHKNKQVLSCAWIVLITIQIRIW